MCDDQAAKAGGSCGPNICRAYRHLEKAMPIPGSPGPLWAHILGECHEDVETFIERHLTHLEERVADSCRHGTLSREAAVLFADQKQAFERLAIRWFKEVLAGWRFPPWIQRSFIALVESRPVTAAGRFGAIRRLLRSLGMGGTHSPLGWGMAYDPIV